MWDAQTDPLGIGLQSRAANRRFTYGVQNPGSNFGPGHSSAWDGYFQALNEAGVSNLGDNSMGVHRGMFDAKPALPSTYNPAFQTSAVDAMGPSNQIGSMAGIQRATQKRRQ